MSNVESEGCSSYSPGPSAAFSPVVGCSEVASPRDERFEFELRV